MFSVTTACAVDEHEDEAADAAAARYFAEVSRANRRRRTAFTDLDSNKRTRQSAQLFTGAKKPQHSRSKQPKKTTKSASIAGSPNFVRYLNQAPVAVALLGTAAAASTGRKRCSDGDAEAGGDQEPDVDDLDDPYEKGSDSRSCSSFLPFDRPVCCSSKARSRSNDEIMFTFLESAAQRNSTHCLFEGEYLEVPQIDRRGSVSTNQERRPNLVKNQRSS